MKPNGIQKAVIGTWPLSGDYGKVDLNTVQKTLEHCYENKLKEFDTAPSYGNGFIEFCLGNVFGDKNDVLINTKVGNLPFKGKNFEIENMKESFQQSLNRLNRDSVNVLFLHNPRDEIKDYDKALEFLDELKEAGSIKQKGICFAKNQEYSEDLIKEFDVVQDDANLLSMNFLEQQIPKNIICMARSTLASGILSGKMTENSVFSPQDHRSGWLKGERLNSLMKRVGEIKKLSDLELPKLAKRFVLSNEKIDKVIFGVKKPEHVDSILEDISKPLDQEIMDKLVALYKNDFGLVGEKDLGY